MQKRIAILGLCLVAQSAVAIDYRPLVDEEAIADRGRYEQDLIACRGYANRLSPGQNAVSGAIAGALLGAAIGAALGDRGSIARSTAGYGAISGATAAAGGTYNTQINVIRNCMMGRGYMILDAPAGAYVGAPTSPAYAGQKSPLSPRCQVAPGSQGCAEEIATLEAKTKLEKSPPAPQDAPVRRENPQTSRKCQIAPGLPECKPDQQSKEQPQ